MEIENAYRWKLTSKPIHYMNGDGSEIFIGECSVEKKCKNCAYTTKKFCFTYACKKFRANSIHIVYGLKTFNF